MIDLLKPSHDKYAKSFFARMMDPPLSMQRRDLYLDMANFEEMRGNARMADNHRRLALSLPLRINGK